MVGVKAFVVYKSKIRVSSIVSLKFCQIPPIDHGLGIDVT
jgi:hypothetical protein